MGSLGVPEMIFIFVLALLLFGPKKLPEVGRTLGKAMSEFRRASSELKATFDREMKTLERETEGIKEAANNFNNETNQYDYNYDYSSYDSGYYGSESHDSTATEATTAGASATEGAESHTAAANLPEGTVAHESGDGAASHSPEATSAEVHSAPPAHQPAISTTEATEHKV